VDFIAATRTPPRQEDLHVYSTGAPPPVKHHAAN